MSKFFSVAIPIFLLIVGGIIAYQEIFLDVPWSTNTKITLKADTAEFLKLCSNVTVTDKDSGYIAIANCMGRVHGFADGHQMTAVMQEKYSLENKREPAPRLWCIDDKINDAEVFNSVLTWINVNPIQFADIVKDLDVEDSATVAMAVAMKALHQAYPCPI